MALPLPLSIWDQPGGPLGEYNALRQGLLQNQYYGPNMESQIANRDSQTKRNEILNKFLPEQQELANAFQKMKNQYYGPNIESEIANRNALTKRYTTMTPLEAEQLKIKNQFAPQREQANVDAQKAMATYRNMGGFGSSMGVGQKEMLGLQQQLMRDHPDWDINTANQAASAYLSGDDTLPNGEKLPPASGLAQSHIAQIQKRNSTAAIQNQAANMDVLASDLNDIDITPLKKFQQLKGRLDYAKYKTQMALGKDVPQEFRDYEAFKDVTSNFAMDALRKGFGTSVVPGYVYATLGKAANPASVWWHDPKLVDTEWNKTKEWINSNAKKYKAKVRGGSTSNVSSAKATLRYNPQTGDFEEIK